MPQLTSQENEWNGQSGSNELLILSSSTGHRFMQFFAETLADCFEIDIVTVGELMVMEDERISVLAGSMDGKPVNEFDYQACVTPCIEVIQTAQPKVLLKDVRNTYTKDNLFSDQNILSYIGFPLTNQEGDPIGLVQASWRREIDQEEADHVLETIGLFVARLSAELVTLHAMRILSALVEGSDLIDNLDALRLLTEQMQTALKVRVAFVGECIPGDDSCFRLLAYCQDGKLLPQAEGKIIPYKGTPCIHLKDDDVFFVRTELQEAFPEQKQNKKQGLVSYLGQNIRDETGQVIGHFALQHDRELMDRTLKADLFKLFSARLNLELRKYRAEQQFIAGNTLPAGTQAEPSPLPDTAAKEITQKLALMQEHVARLENGAEPQIWADLQALRRDLAATQALLL